MTLTEKSKIPPLTTQAFFLRVVRLHLVDHYLRYIDVFYFPVAVFVHISRKSRVSTA